MKGCRSLFIRVIGFLMRIVLSGITFCIRLACAALPAHWQE